jgi:malonyl-CoA/methylmalonyl-CoA synthetase
MCLLSPPIIARSIARGPSTAIIDVAGRHSYTDLSEASHNVAVRLLGGHHDLQEARVAFLVPPSFHHVAIQWGIWRAGGIAVPLPLGHPRVELEYLIQDSGAAVVVGDPPHRDMLSAIASAAGARFFTSREVVQPCNRATVAGDTYDAGAFAARRAMIVYTSGTTGKPKGVVTTHATIAAQIESIVTAWEWTAEDRTLLVLPLHHVHGIINVVGSALWSGATLEILPRFDVEATWERLASGELTVFTAVPTIYRRLIKSWDAASPDVRKARSEGCRKLRLMMSGSAALPRQILARWEEITGHVLLERYGMTEVGMALSNPLHERRRPGFVGEPMPGVQVRLVNGELHLKGPGVFSEYWRRPESTRAAFLDGWFRTGDIAMFEQGSYRLLGRSSVDIIKTGGDKISALEVEEVLRTHPAIAECAVVGIDDPEWGQRVCVAIEMRPGRTLTLAELREWAKSRMAPSKIPRTLVCVSELPRNAMGKIVKPELTTLFAQPAPAGRQQP